jgi:hypothetical protein
MVTNDQHTEWKLTARELKGGALVVETQPGARVAWMGWTRGGLSACITDAQRQELGRLFAAAPDMLAALRCIVSDSSGLLSAVDDEGHELTQPLRADLERARAAIAKATQP